MEHKIRAWGIRGLFYGFVIFCAGIAAVWFKANFGRFSDPDDPAKVAFMVGAPYDSAALLVILIGIAVVLMGCLALIVSMVQRLTREERRGG